MSSNTHHAVPPAWWDAYLAGGADESLHIHYKHVVLSTHLESPLTRAFAVAALATEKR